MVFLDLDKNKKLVFQVLLVFTIIAGCVFAFINNQRGQTVLAAIELLTVLISFGLLLLVKKTQSREKFLRLALIYLTLFFSIMMFAFSVEGVSITVFSWTLVIPLISYLLLGVKSGFIMTAIFYSLSAYIFFKGYHGHLVMLENVSYANIIICALVFWAISHSYEHSNRYAKDKLNQMAVFDHLTGLYNRSMISRLFNQATEKADSNLLQNISLISFDLDHFKQINDQFGHAIGDEVLKLFSKLLQENIPAGCSAFRFGGEEFVVVFPESNELNVNTWAESIRKKTKKITAQGMPADFVVSVSVGVTTEPLQVANLNDMLKVADKRLYQAKQKGRNIVVNQG